MNKFLTPFLLLLCTAFRSYGQEGSEIEMADKMHESGMIWVVVASVVLIFIGIVIFLVMQERKLNRLERSIKR